MITRDDRSLNCTASLHNTSCCAKLFAIADTPWGTYRKIFHSNYLMLQKLLLMASLRAVSPVHPSSIGPAILITCINISVKPSTVSLMFLGKSF